MKFALIYGFINFDNVKYKEQESALRVFPLCFPHGYINYVMCLRNVNQTTKYFAQVILDSYNY